MRTNALVLGLILLALSVCGADDGSRASSGLVKPLFTSSPTTIAAGATKICTVEIGAGEIQGLFSYMTSDATLNVQLQFRTSNTWAGPYVYGTSVNSIPMTTAFTITTSVVSTDLLLAPNRYVQVTAVNNGSAGARCRDVSVFNF